MSVIRLAVMILLYAGTVSPLQAIAFVGGEGLDDPAAAASADEC